MDHYSRNFFRKAVKKASAFLLFAILTIAPFTLFAKSMEKVTVSEIINNAMNYGIGQENAGSFSLSYDDMWVTLIGLVVVLIIVVALLVFTYVNLSSLINVKEGGEPYTWEGTFTKTLRIMKNRYFALFGNFVLGIVIITFLTITARGVGLHQGYKPEQPVKFSHQLHAGKYEMDCQYCHSGASKGKNAWIPSVNVCWNCHNTNGIGEGPKYGPDEIKKVRDAYSNNDPIEWVRIHNLPDHAYFNHQQHVVVGNLKCETCHGPVQEMEEVYQFSTLSMGWCINCHRETEVNALLYEEMGYDYTTEDGKVKTAADLGATNCARCHY